MLNKVCLIGNVGKDPEIKSLNNGNQVAQFSIATSEKWRDKATGEKREKTEWHRIVVFNDGLVKVIEQYVHKGDKLYIEGKLQTRKWEDNSGVEKYTTEVVLSSFDSKLVMLGSKGDRGAPSEDSYGTQKNAGGSGEPVNYNKELDDEIPF